MTTATKKFVEDLRQLADKLAEITRGIDRLDRNPILIQATSNAVGAGRSPVRNGHIK